MNIKRWIIIFAILDLLGYVYKQQTIREVQSASQGEVVVVGRRDDIPEPQRAKASWYDHTACYGRTYGKDCKTANGDVFDETKYTLACSGKFRLGDRVRLCYLDRCIDAVCNDRGGFEKYGRTFDLTYGAFSTLADTDLGVIDITWELK